MLLGVSRSAVGGDEQRSFTAHVSTLRTVLQRAAGGRRVSSCDGRRRRKRCERRRADFFFAPAEPRHASLELILSLALGREGRGPRGESRAETAAGYPISMGRLGEFRLIFSLFIFEGCNR